MDCRDRVMTALELGIPDRVPSFFEGMMEIFKNNFFIRYEDDIEEDDILLGSYGDLTPYKFYGADAVWLHSSPIRMKEISIEYKKIPLDNENLSLDRWGHISSGTTVMNRRISFYLDGYLKTEEKWKEWIDAGYFDYEIDNGWIDRWSKAYKEALEGGLMLIPVDTTWEKIREAMGMGRFAYFLRKKPDFLRKILDRLFKMYEESAKAINDCGFEVCTWADDSAYKGNTMINPKQFEEFIIPHYIRLNQISHKQCLTFWHSDGFTEPFFEGLIKSGFNGIQSLEPAAGMDLAHLKKTWGDKVCLLGNVDVSRLLSFGTKEQIVNEVKKEISVAADGGGYILSPCTDIIDSIPPENIEIMMKALKEYGKYPINFAYTS